MGVISHPRLLNNIASIHIHKGDLDKALNYCQESLSLEKNEVKKALIYGNIALIYYKKSDYQKAAQYLHKTIEINEKYGNYRNVSETKLQLGEMYREMKDYKNAEKYLSEALESAKKLEDKYLEASGYLYSGWLYRDKGDEKTAREYFTRAYSLFKSIGAEGYALAVLTDIRTLDKSNNSPLKTIGNFFFWILIFTFYLSVLSKHGGMSCIQRSHEETNNNHSNQNDYKEVNECLTLASDGDYQKAIDAGKLAVKKYPDNPEAYYCLGTSYYYTGKLKLAYKNMKKAESLASDKEDLIDVYDLIGLILNRMGYLNDALSYYDKALSLAKEVGNTYMQAKILNNIATIYTNNKEFDKALNYHNESLNLITNEKDKAIIYNNIATIYYIKGNVDKATKYFQKAIEITERYGNYYDASRIKLNLGTIYELAGDYENAEKYLTEGLEGVKRAGDRYLEAKGYSYLGDLYRDKGDKETAREYYDRAYNLFKSIGAEKDAKNILNEIKKSNKLN